MALNSNNTLQIILNGYSFETHSGKAHFLIYSTTMPNDIVIDSKYFEQIQENLKYPIACIDFVQD